MLAGVEQVHDLGGFGELVRGDVPDPGGAVAEDGQLADVIGAAADAFCLDQVPEHGGGLEGGDVTAGAGVPHRVSVLAGVVLGEEHGELDLAGAGPPVLAFSFPPGGFLGGRGHAGAVDRAVEHVRQRGRRQRHQLPAGDQRGPLADCGGLRGAAGLGGPLHPLDGQRDPGQVFQQPGGLRERPGGRGDVVHRGQARGQGRAGHAELGIARREPCLHSAQLYQARRSVTGPRTVSNVLSR